MENIFKAVTLVGVATITGFLVIPTASAYEEGAAGKAVVEGKMTFNGESPPPRLFNLSIHPNAEFCSQVDNDGKGNRILRHITVNNGNLQDVIVYIQNISNGKPFAFNGTDVKINGCRFLVQGGPSTFVGVVVKGAELRILNEDADPNDPKAFKGVLMNTHAYEVSGSISNTVFNLPLSEKGQVLNKRVILRKKDSVMKLEGDNHNFMTAWFYPIENPYFAIVGPDGTYAIDQVPAGKYKLVAWHPILGIQEKEIEVGATSTVTANFEFSISISKSAYPGFTRDAVSKLHSGMPSHEIEKMFGKPNRREATRCEPGWDCTVLVYIMPDEAGNYIGDNRLYVKTMRANRAPPSTLYDWIINFVH